MNKATSRITIHSPVLEEIQRRDRPEFRGRGSESNISAPLVQRDLSRYYAMIKRELHALRLTAAEASLICDALNGSGLLKYGTLDHPSARQAVELTLRDSIALERMDKKWGVSEGPFAAKVAMWTEGQALAILDTVERFWLDCETATVQSVGLTREEVTA